nr:hypothetical protein Iba_chr02bCG13900 [Ipomoea batatas]
MMTLHLDQVIRQGHRRRAAIDNDDPPPGSSHQTRPCALAQTPQTPTGLLAGDGRKTAYIHRVVDHVGTKRIHRAVIHPEAPTQMNHIL